jgi:HD-GYP domain-containing protein (c-di-GMP phosphodiesterase class II)
MHDCGKLCIPTYLLHKLDGLTEEEAFILRAHVDHSVRILTGSGVPEPVLRAISEHHERWDSGGYPAGTAGMNQSLLGRCLQIVQRYGALTVRDSLRRQRTAAEALDVIEHGAGTAFDPELAAAFVRMERSTGNAPTGAASPLRPSAM